jgi:stage III sporulation protein AA
MMLPETDIDRFEKVLESLHAQVQDIVLSHWQGLLEIRMVLGYPLTLNHLGKLTQYGLQITKDHIETTRVYIGGFREDGRTGMDETLHRYATVPNRYDGCSGIVIRLARAHPGAANPLLEYILDPTASMLMVGKPGTRKTTVLRDIARVSSIPAPHGAGLDQLCVVVDTSGEIAGYGDLPHPSIGHALRIEVGDQRNQAKRLRYAVRNLTAGRIVIDEVGYADDVDEVRALSKLGVGVFFTCHGYTLQDVVDNEIFHPLLGMKHGLRTSNPSCKMALELTAAHWLLHPNLSESVDALLSQQTPNTIKIDMQATEGRD